MWDFILFVLIPSNVYKDHLDIYGTEKRDGIIVVAHEYAYKKGNPVVHLGKHNSWII